MTADLRALRARLARVGAGARVLGIDPEPCPACDGLGEDPRTDARCSWCKGTGIAPRGRSEEDAERRADERDEERRRA